MRLSAAGAVLGIGLLGAWGGGTALPSSAQLTGTVRATGVLAASSVPASPRPAGRLDVTFQVAGIPSGASVVHADLTMPGWRGLPAVQVSAAPRTSQPAATTTAGAGGPAVDVTSLVRGNGPLNVSLAAASGAAGAAAVTSASGVVRPTLRITWQLSQPRKVAVVHPRVDGSAASGTPVIGQQAPTTNPAPSPTSSPTPTPDPTTTPNQPGTCTVSALLVPSCGVWWGAMANSGNTGLSADQAFSRLEAQVGRPFDIDHYYFKDGQLFPSQTLINRAHEPGKNRLLLLNWKPATDHTWAQVAAGAVDARIDSEAAYLKTHFTDKFFLVIWHEPENDVIPTAGSGMTASDYAAMWRHVVLRLRGDGVTNAVTVICYEATPQWASKPWWPQLWPGSDVVDWMGEDAYSMGTSTVWGGGFAATVNRVDHYSYPNWNGFYNWAQTIAPNKPIMIPEYGAQEITGDPAHKAAFFLNEAIDLRSMPAIKAVVYWNNPGQPDAIDSSPTSLAAFRQAAVDNTVNPQVAFGERVS
jgi:hypothetical protein